MMKTGAEFKKARESGTCIQCGKVITWWDKFVKWWWTNVRSSYHPFYPDYVCSLKCLKNFWREELEGR